MTSIRRFLVVVLLATITLFNFVAALHGYRTSMVKAEELFDDKLEDIAQMLAYGDYSQVIPVQHNDNSDDVAIQIWQNNKLIQKSNNSPTTPIAHFTTGFHDASFNHYRWRAFVLFNAKNQQWIFVAERTDLRFALAENIVLTSILPIIFCLPILGFLIWIIVGQGLKPLILLAKALSLKKQNDLSPLEFTHSPKELKPVINSTNDLLQRIESSFEREKRFSGDAAHELRTPLSALKIHIYNLSKIIPENNPNIKIVNESIDRMTHLIEQMLTLYRTSPEQYQANFSTVDLYKITQKVITERYQAIADKNQQIELIGESCLIQGDQFALETLIKNLLDNANKYTPEDGNIEITLKQDSSNIILKVEDSGIGIAPELRERVFDRFYRVNGDQHNSQILGCGLGLSIVQHIVTIHKASIALSDSHFSNGLAISVTFPLMPG